MSADLSHMRHALALAERALGTTAPNPAVGCVIVSKDERVVGRGWTQPGGRPHAETMALAQAGEEARGADRSRRRRGFRASAGSLASRQDGSGLCSLFVLNALRCQARLEQPPEA